MVANLWLQLTKEKKEKKEKKRGGRGRGGSLASQIATGTRNRHTIVLVHEQSSNSHYHRTLARLRCELGLRTWHGIHGPPSSGKA
jgi:hypothetical protein